MSAELLRSLAARVRIEQGFARMVRARFDNRGRAMKKGSEVFVGIDTAKAHQLDDDPGSPAERWG